MSDHYPQGWSYEGPDWSVGITTGGWVHEDCPVPMEDDNDIDAIEEELAVVPDGKGTLVIWHRITCVCCGEQRLVTSYDMDADWLAEQYVGACPVCEEPTDYCQGHGEIGDPAGHALLKSLMEENDV